MTIHSDGWPEMGVRVAFGFTQGLVPGALNWICTVGKVTLSVVSIAVNVSDPCVAERMVNVALPLESVPPVCVGPVMVPSVGLPVMVTILPVTGLPLLVTLMLAVIVAVVMLSAGMQV